MSNNRILVCGAGGFIGGHLVSQLLAKGFDVRAVDIKPYNEWYQRFRDAENIESDLRESAACQAAVRGVSDVYNLACDMGGMGFIEKNKAKCMLSVLINTHLLVASAANRALNRYFYASSACVYAHDKQTDPGLTGLKEGDAYPAMPEDGYGWEKLFSERLCRHFSEDFEITTKVARFHNVYGPFGTYEGGREKAPAAICRKVVEAIMTGSGEIEIWGDGEQTRSFTFIDDCLTGIDAIMKCDEIDFPINLGSAEKVSINQLVDVVEDIAEVKLKRRYNLNAPKGVNGRNSDNTLIKKMLKWEPSISLRAGMEKTYAWIYDQVAVKY